MNADHWLALAYAGGIAATALLSAIAAWITKKVRDSIEDINDAVNHRHKRGADSPKLYDAVLHLHERVDCVDGKCDQMILWKHQYDAGPLGTGEKVVKFVDDTNKKIESIAEDVRKIKDSCPEGGKLPCHWLVNRQKQIDQDNESCN